MVRMSVYFSSGRWKHGLGANPIHYLHQRSKLDHNNQEIEEIQEGRCGGDRQFLDDGWHPSHDFDGIEEKQEECHRSVFGSRCRCNEIFHRKSEARCIDGKRAGRGRHCQQDVIQEEQESYFDNGGTSSIVGSCSQFDGSSSGHPRSGREDFYGCRSCRCSCGRTRSQQHGTGSDSCEEGCFQTRCDARSF